MRSLLWSAALLCAAGAFSSVQAATASDVAWSIPTNDEIRRLLAERMRHNGVGTVVGVIEPAGQRVIAYGRSGAADNRPLDGVAMPPRGRPITLLDLSTHRSGLPSMPDNFPSRCWAVCSPCMRARSTRLC